MFDLAEVAQQTPANSWTDILAGIAVVLSLCVGGVMATDRVRSRKQRASDSSDRTQAAVVTARECDLRHEALVKIIDDKHTFLGTRITELKSDVQDGFSRIEKLIDKPKSHG